MGRTLIYVLGILALTNTDLLHASAFYRLFLPVCDLFFIIFLLMELVFFFSIVGFSSDDYNVYDLIRDIFDLRYDIQEVGAISAITTLFISLFETLLLFTGLYYAIELGLDMALI